MKCVVLAAGYATRLYPLTVSFPKPLLDVGGKTILDWLVDDIDSRGGTNGYIVVSNHVYRRHFIDWANAKKLNAPIKVLDDGTSSNETRLGAVNDMLLAVREENIDEDMLVIAGDNVLDFSLARFIDYAKEKPGSCAMRYYEGDREKLRRSGVAEVDGFDRLTDMTEKPENPKSNWCVPPFYYYKKKDLALLKTAVERGCAADAPGSALMWLGSKTDVYLMEMPAKRYDIGNLASYERARQVYKGVLS